MHRGRCGTRINPIWLGVDEKGITAFGLCDLASFNHWLIHPLSPLETNENQNAHLEICCFRFFFTWTVQDLRKLYDAAHITTYYIRSLSLR